MILRIKATDFENTFCGFGEQNFTLDNYIDLFNNNDNFKYFQIECLSDNDLNIGQIAYIVHNVSVKCKHFIKTDFDDYGNPTCYTLCFYKD